jgi:hypothetical protein
MAAELPPSWFKTTGSLASLRWVMGWQAPDLASKLKHGNASLANMRPRDCLLCGVHPGWDGATTVLLVPHTTGVLWAPTVAPLPQLHCVGGHLRPPALSRRVPLLVMSFVVCRAGTLEAAAHSEVPADQRVDDRCSCVWCGGYEPSNI